MMHSVADLHCSKSGICQYMKIRQVKHFREWAHPSSQGHPRSTWSQWGSCFLGCRPQSWRSPFCSLTSSYFQPLLPTLLLLLLLLWHKHLGMWWSAKGELIWLKKLWLKKKRWGVIKLSSLLWFICSNLGGTRKNNVGAGIPLADKAAQNNAH